MSAAILFLSAMLSVVPQPSLRTFLARREYDSAVQFYATRLSYWSHDVQDWRNLARVYDHWQGCACPERHPSVAKGGLRSTERPSRIRAGPETCAAWAAGPH